MRVMILGLNYAPEKVGIAVYTTGMAEELVASGHEVRVIAGQPYYPAWRVQTGHSAWAFSRGRAAGVSIQRVPHYIPAMPSGLRRLFHHCSFAAAAAAPAMWSGLTWRPDMVIAVAPSLVSAPIARLAAAMAGASSWLHIQDFEVEAAFATRLLAGGGVLAALASWFERSTLRSFHTVSTISPEMCRRLVGKGVPGDRVVEFRNWCDPDAIRPQDTSTYRRQWGIRTRHVALYSGNIASKQGIETVIDAARRMAGREDLTFVICGEGPNRTRLEAMAKGLGNVQFHDLQPAEQLNELMALATIHLLPQIAGAADLMLPSKLTNMLASGRPVVATAPAGTGLAREIEDCGMAVPPGDATALADAISALLDDEPRRRQYAAAARRRAEEVWAKGAVLNQFIRRLEATGGAPGMPASPAKEVPNDS